MKKSQINSHVITCFIIAIGISLILIFGYKAWIFIKDSQCKHLTILEADLKDSIRIQSTDIGSRKQFIADIPCNADFAFAIDLDRKDYVKESFQDFPIIKDSIESGSKSNFFVVKDKEIIESFDIGNIDISYPYYECFDIKRGHIAIFIEGKGAKTGLLQSDAKYDCTFDKSYSSELAPKDLSIICKDIPGECPEDDILTISRTIDDGRITVDISSKEPLKEFKFWEELPKCVSEGITENIDFIFAGVNEKYEINEQGEIIKDGKLLAPGYTVLNSPGLEIKIEKPDPIMKWHFSGFNIQNEKIIYKLENLKKEITSDCLRQFRGAATKVIKQGALSAKLYSTPTAMSFGSAVNFNCIGEFGIGQYSYSLDFGDNSMPVTAQNYDYTFASEGIYHATCTISDGTSTESDSISVLRCPQNCGSGICDKRGVCKSNEWCDEREDCENNLCNTKNNECS